MPRRMEQTQNPIKKHVAVLAFPFGCHASSLLKLVQKLATACPGTQFSFLSTERSNKSLSLTLEDKLVENLKACKVADGVPMNHAFSGNPIELVELFLKAAPGNFNKALDLTVEETGLEISCLITDAFISFSGEIAKNLGVPWIPVWIPAPHSLSAHIYADLIHPHCADARSGNDGSVRSGSDIGDKTLEIIPGLSKMRIADLPDEVLYSDKQQNLFSYMLSQVRDMLPQANALVMNFYHELYPLPLLKDLKFRFPYLLNVGFLTISIPPPPLPSSDTDVSGCLSWLDSQKAKSVAYIGFGTVVNIPCNEIEEIAGALEECRMPFLWSLRNELKDSLPNGFLERTSTHGKVVSWAPQAHVLAHASIGVFVTHCGFNSVNESIVNGVPMICRPFFGDNRINARIIEDIWGAGVRVHGGVFTKKGVVKCLELILQNERGGIIRSRVQELKELVLEAAGPNGLASKDFQTLVEKISFL